MEKAFNANTVMALFFNAADKSSVTHEQFLAMCKNHKVPSFVDAAADVPPVENLFKFHVVKGDLRGQLNYETEFCWVFWCRILCLSIM